ncbi:hypothetical protein JN535_04085 [Cellulosimicrobium cellulans]|uniref:hypothetical protein n=1 Tax=Cellulosimicrobium cellulans TaxID=1710 RepID=UPI00196455B0|nr:hypothetical protein [Cellulosimicrobium cellulans]MBN0039353.1 hypothetical protein [Cellulosimicrobium cellulans]
MSAATEARDTAARAIARRRSEGLHGRAALADAVEVMRNVVRILLREHDDDVHRWVRALWLVEARLERLDASAHADEREPSPYCAQHHPFGSSESCGPCGVARKRHAIWRDAGAGSTIIEPAPAHPHAWRADFYELHGDDDPRLLALYAAVGYRWTRLPRTVSGLLAALDHFEQRGDRVVQVSVLHGEATKGEVGVDVLDLTDADHRCRVPVGGLVGERELSASTSQGFGDGRVGAEQAQGSSPSLSQGAAATATPGDGDDAAATASSSGPSVGEQVRPLGETPDEADTPGADQ